MKPSPPSDAGLALLAHQVDEQFVALQTGAASHVRFRGLGPGERAELPAAPEQQAFLERATGEPFETFRHGLPEGAPFLGF